MGYLNQKSYIITDSKGNINYLYWENGDINCIIYKLNKKPVKRVISENSNIEFDVTIDSSDTIYILAQHYDGNLKLYYYENESWTENVLAEKINYKILNLNLITIENNLHFLYCVNTKENTYKIYHHYLSHNQWITNELGSITTKLVLNNFSLIKKDKDIILTYYDLKGNSEQIYIRTFNIGEGKWSKEIKLTNSLNDKLYLDSLIDEKGNFHICYSEYINGNFEIIYKKFDIDNMKEISSFNLSNPSNCSYPTIINYKEKLWICWIEYNHLVSCFSDDLGNSWSNPYLWKESKRINFLRYKYIDNSKVKYKFNYSFGKEPPDLSFIGFGSLKDTEEIPLLNKKKEEIELNSSNIVIEENLNNVIRDIQNKKIRKVNEKISISEIERKLDEIINRLDKLEKYIFRRRRPF